MRTAATKRVLLLGIAAVGLILSGSRAISPAQAAGSVQAGLSVQAGQSVRAAGSVQAAGSAQTLGICSSTPFRSKPSAHRWYRIPAMVKTTGGALVAFAEQRDRMIGDVGDFDVVTARSADHGCSWSTPVVIGDDGANRVSNPVPIVDTTTGEVLLFSVITLRQDSGGTGKGLYLQTSSDDGRTFSALLAHPVRPAGTYHGGLTGPGHGLQLSVTHPGRLILALGYKTSQGLYGAYGIYSDDHGTSWRTGFDQQDQTGDIDYLEGTIAELSSGDLFISYRELHDGAKAGTARQYGISKNGGASLSSPFQRLPLKIVSVQGSALALPGEGAGDGELLFSAPAVTQSNLRRDMTIFVSTTAGRTWTARYQVELQDTPASYSDLVQLDPSSIGVLYETGTVTWKERIAFESISVAVLTHPAKIRAMISYQRSSSATHASAHAKVMTTVKVSGIGSPPGRVTLAYQRKGAKAAGVAVDLTYSNRGVRLITLPKLKKGTYQLRLTYSGTGRIAGVSRSAGVLHVIR
jgi:sialidase-1